MMHGHEKSDSVIVAWKPANKVLRPAVEQSVAEPATAEPVEPRAETEGNADQQSTCRAQSRISVSTSTLTHLEFHRFACHASRAPRCSARYPRKPMRNVIGLAFA